MTSLYENLKKNEKRYIKTFVFDMEIRKKIVSIYKDFKFTDIILTACLIYFYRIKNYENFTFLFNDKSICLPITTDFSEINTFEQTLYNVVSYIDTAKINALNNKESKIMSAFEESIFSFENNIDDYENINFKQEKELILAVSGNEASISLITNNLPQDIHKQSIFDELLFRINSILQYCVDNKEKSCVLENIMIMQKSEYTKILYEWNDTHVDYDENVNIVDHIELQASLNKDKIAVRFGDLFLTYEQLNKKSNQLANYLRKNGLVESDTLVAICLERSLYIMIGILAILKAGGAYVPLDITYPEERLNFILNDTKSLFLITSKKLITKFKNFTGNAIFLENFFDTSLENDKNLSKNVTPNNLAYVIYTSGTTGFPKGVKIAHKSVINHMLWMIKEFSFSKKDIVLQKTIFSFDASVWELFIPLMSGAELVFADPEAHLDPNLLIQHIIKYNITTIQLVPSMLREMLKCDEFKQCFSLNKVFSGGELLAFDIKQLFFLKSDAHLHNLYGPTETTIECTSHTCKNEEIDLVFNSIGRPINNVQIYVLDKKLHLIPVGIAGELYVAGDCLAKGYLNNDDLTKEKFIINPYATNNSLMYATGDLVRWLSNGEIEYVGRKNDQVKIRGFRVELGEIEASLLKHEMIYQSAVIFNNDESSNEIPSNCLVGYIVLKNKEIDINVKDLRNFLKQSLPDYMLPNFFVVLKDMPVSKNGKTDKKALLSLRNIKILSDKTHITPKTATEKKLLNIWKHVLKIKSIGILDDFFELGGDSLSAIHVLSLCKEDFSIELNVSDFFNFPTIQSFSLLLDDKMNNLVKNNFNQKDGICKIPFPIITLQPQGDKTPMFLIHPVGGTVFWYTPMIKYLGKDRPIYGIQDPGVELKQSFFSSIEEIAQFYLESIQKIQPKGPYIIGGASFGSTVAVEIARKLKDLNETIYCIPVFDGWAIYPDKLKDDNYFKETMQRQHDDLRKQFSEIGVHNIESLLDLQWSRLLLLWEYTMNPIEDKIVLFKSEQLLPAFQTIETSLNYWDEYTQQAVALYMTPGNHETMFQEPNVKILTDQIKDMLKKFVE